MVYAFAEYLRKPGSTDTVDTYLRRRMSEAACTLEDVQDESTSW